jgi:hypothetical protein
MCEQCPDPPPCPAGTYSGTGKIEAGFKACRSCDAGKYASSAGLSSCVGVWVCARASFYLAAPLDFWVQGSSA